MMAMIVTCLIGDPVEHSVSSSMYGYFADKTGLDYAHVKFKVLTENKANLKLAMRALQVLGIRGANITLPYKINVMKYLDYLDESATAIGAVNTILNDGGRLIGYNTDGVGAILAIERYLRKINKDDKVLVFGAGGAARAIVYELARRTDNIVIINRNAEEARKLKALNKHIQPLPLTDRNIIEQAISADFIVNATSVGMWPNDGMSIMSDWHFAEVDKRFPIKAKCFFDAVFNPFLTRFLSTAKRYHTRVCPGLYMMIYQGTRAFELWTGKKVQERHIGPVFDLLKDEIHAKYT